MPKWLPLLPVSFFRFNTCTYMQIHVAHGRLPLGSTVGAQVVSVCPETADLSDSGLRLSLLPQSGRLEYLLLQSGLTGDHFIHQASVCIFEPREGFIAATDQCLNSVSSSA